MPRLPLVRADRAGVVLASLALFVALGGPSEAASLLDGKRLKAKSVSSAKLRNGAVTSAKLRTGAVTSAKLGSNAVTGAKVRDGAIAASDLDPAVLAGVLRGVPDGGVGTTKLGDASVTAAKLADASVTAAKLAPSVVDAGKLADGAVGPAKLSDGAVGPAKLADGAVTGAKLADGAVTGAKVADGSLGAADVASLRVTQSINFPSIPAASCDRELVTVPGAGVTDADTVLVSANASDLILAPEGMGQNLTVGGQGSNGPNIYRVVLCNPSAANVDPPATRFTLLVFR